MILASLRQACGLLLLCGSLLLASPARSEVSIGGYYRGDIWHNAAGGVRTGSAYLDDAGLWLASDLPAIPHGSFFASLLYNNATTFSDVYVGDLQGLSNIDTFEAVRLYEFWYQHRIGNSLTLKVGLFDLNSEFDAIDTAGVFLNSSHGIGVDYGQSGVAGPSIFPVTSMAIRFHIPVSASSGLRYALLDGVPGDPDDSSRTTVRFNSDEGVLHAFEYDYRADNRLRLALGAWAYSAPFEALAATVPGGGASPAEKGNAGVYGFVEFPLTDAQTRGFRIDAFLRHGYANPTFNPVERYTGAGIVLSQFWPARSNDVLGLAIAHARVGADFAQWLTETGMAPAKSETAIEFTYRILLRDWLMVQPDIQYILNPGARRSTDHAWAIGLRFELSFEGVSW